MVEASQDQGKHHVVIVGGGFAGLYAAKVLSRDDSVRVTVIDKRNYHLFQPLLYQVATGTLSPGDIATPIRHILRGRRNVRVLQAAAQDVDPAARRIEFQGGGHIEYDTLIAATGVKHSYFGHDEWREDAPGLKTVEHALEMRQRIFSAFEAAEMEPGPARRRAYMTFVIVGGGPTGVELAGALGELAQSVLPAEFQNIDTRQTRIVLAEGLPAILSSYPPDLRTAAQEQLERLGVEVRTGTLVTALGNGEVTLSRKDAEDETLRAQTVLWAAGVQASRFGKALAQRTEATQERAGKLRVAADLSLPHHPNIFVIGDLGHCEPAPGEVVPGVAQGAIQQGEYVARLLQARLGGRAEPAPFRYRDKGSMAVIGRHAAVADLKRLHMKGSLAWYLWLFVHIRALVAFGNRLLVLTRWGWSYTTRQSGVRLITSVPEARTEPVERAHHRTP